MKRLFFLLCLVVLNSSFTLEPIIVGIAGGTGSGKTTLAQKIKEAFGPQAVLINQDSYYKDLSSLSIAERTKVNFDHPDSIDFELLKQHLVALKQGMPIEKPVYNFHIHTREAKCEHIEANKLIIIEGILLFAIPELRRLFDIKLFVETDDDIRLLRRIDRDMNERSRTLKSVIDQYLTTVKPMHDVFVEPSKQFADLIVPHGGENAIALNLIISRLREDIGKQR